MPVRLSSLDRRRQILRTASGIFARRGYRGTTTREIAQRAGINEALLFRHFPSKAKLYWTLIEELCSARGRRHNIEAGGTDLEIFTAIAREMLVRNARDTELTRLLWFTALENHTLSQRFFRTFIAVYYEELATYIRRRVREGAFRNVDPLLSARGFLGMVVYHFLVQELFGARKFQKFDPETVAATLAGIWLNGMQSPLKAISNGHNGNHARAGKRFNNEN
jgi:AcrR family transcriptional regulator